MSSVANVARPVAGGSFLASCAQKLCALAAAIKNAVVGFFKYVCPFLFKKEPAALPVVAKQVPAPEQEMVQIRSVLPVLDEENQETAALPQEPPSSRVEAGQSTLRERILELRKQNPNVTPAEAAVQLGARSNRVNKIFQSLNK